MNATYSLFLRNWINNRATEEQVNKAVEMQLLTLDEAATIKSTDRLQQT
ncbi:hypothetical protein RB298_29080 [Priestia sp. BR_2]